MSLIEYHKSIGKELEELKSRFRNLLGSDFHRLLDGKHKETILKNVLARHLPRGISAKSGFIRFSSSKVSSEIDIILHYNERPMLFQNDDVIITSPFAVFGGIEVKTKVRQSEAEDILNKISDYAEMTNKAIRTNQWYTMNFENYSSFVKPWFSLFAFEANIDPVNFLTILNKTAEGKFERIVHCACLGPDTFVRFWDNHEHTPSSKAFTGWKIYKLEGLAFSYFISNMIWQDNANTMEASDWFALNEKEVHLIAEQSFTYKTN